MQTITVTGAGPLSYAILKDFHSTAQAIFEYRNAHGQNVEEEDHHYEIDIMAQDESDAKEIFLNYIRKLNDLGIMYHHTHLTYLVQHLVAFEGNYINEEAISNDYVRKSLQSLFNLLKLYEKDAYEKLNFEVTHKINSNKDFDNYVKINNAAIIKPVISAAIAACFQQIKNESYLYSYQLYTALNAIKVPISSNIELLLEITGFINPKKFENLLLYSICFQLRAYLNQETHLNPENVFLTENQARVIYYTCKLNGLLNVTHDLERDGLNYIRMLLNNSKHLKPMISEIVKDNLDH